MQSEVMTRQRFAAPPFANHPLQTTPFSELPFCKWMLHQHGIVVFYVSGYFFP